MLAVAIIVAGILGLVALMNPRWGLYGFWFLTLLYPTKLLYALLPFNVHFDDLFLLWLTLACVRMAPPDVFASRPVRLAGMWYLTVLLGTAVGMVTAPSY